MRQTLKGDADQGYLPLGPSVSSLPGNSMMRDIILNHIEKIPLHTHNTIYSEMPAEENKILLLYFMFRINAMSCHCPTITPALPSVLACALLNHQCLPQFPI